MAAVQAELSRRGVPTQAERNQQAYDAGELDNVPAWLLPSAGITPREEYPNQLDPDAMGQGAQLTEPVPAQPGEPGSVAGAQYNISGTLETDAGWPNAPNWQTTPISSLTLLVGPISRSSSRVSQAGASYTLFAVFVGSTGGQVSLPIESTDIYGRPIQRNGSYSPVRADGGTDPAAAPEQPATFAPNPARSRPTTPGLTPNLLPTTPTPDYPNYSPDTGERWPETQPVTPPDTQPIAPPAPAPNLAPTTTPDITGEPGRETAPAPAGRPDLDPDAPPREAPDLATDPDTPAKPAPTGAKQTSKGNELPRTYELPDGTRITDNADGSRTIDSPLDSPWLDQLHNPNRPLIPPVMPVPVPVGQRQPLRTPSPDLMNRQQPNPNIQPVQQPVRQTPTEAPKGSCFYEFQRVADIQRKATTTEQLSSNPLSGFLGLYGLQIEARTKLGQTYDNTERIKERIRPEDFPIIVPDQIAKANPVPRSIESLGELGVWIVEQLDGVVGKWPMEVPVPGVSSQLAVPNISEAIAEMFGMMISQQVTAAQILNTSSRTLAQAGSATQQAALANMIAKGNAEFLGYEAKPTAVDMPLTYTPGNDPGEGLLEESTAKIRGWENTDGTDLKQILSDLMHAAQIIKAVYWRKLDAKGDFQSQIDEQIRGKSAWLDELGRRPSSQQSDDWEQYLRDVEAGFTAHTNDATPYGRSPDEGPQIRDVTPDPPTST